MNLSLIESCVELIELGAFATKEDIAKALKSSIKLTKEQAKPLTDEDIMSLYWRAGWETDDDVIKFGRAIEERILK